MPPQGDVNASDGESGGPVLVPTLSHQHHVSKLVWVDSDESNTEHNGLSDTPNPKSYHISSTCVIGWKVPAQSARVQWQDGRITVLPMIMKKGVNICESRDVEVVKFFASFPESIQSSKHVLHLPATDMEHDNIVKMVECSLCDNKPIVIQGNKINNPTGITIDWLNRKFRINPDMPVSIHDAEVCVTDSAHPHKSGTISSLVADQVRRKDVDIFSPQISKGWLYGICKFDDETSGLSKQHGGALYHHSLISLCLMVIKCQDYIAANVETCKIQPSETALLAKEICHNLMTFLGIKNVGSISTILFSYRQDIAGKPVDRDLLWRHLK
ncbi:uncharacterized protein BJ212DRAFT_1298682 [Suillus subaureus]|uniref:Uncharacterized protein n=1 Tax=Suillus subaureus TaxID=48587 RepID=A0A9P7JF07_9AGAM|nr:uncharacterized protein BJ212DRAFT_1298682 [Suillus subaureus]KAG1818612.1 hypothetical protein BJ212DRAFT_1298682 [Suillus subaureus]